MRRQFPVSAYRKLQAALRRHSPGRFTDADPFLVARVDPARITDSILEHSPKYPQWGRVVGGDWDRKRRPFAARPVVRGITQHYGEGLPWDETALREAFNTQLERFGNAWGYHSPSEFPDRCREIERLYERIETHGYQSQRTLRAAGERATPVLDEVNVDVARDGAMLWRAYGQHRLAIAQLLDITEIPVLIHRRHRQWQTTREGIHRRHRSPGSCHHPDIQDHCFRDTG